MSDDKEDLKAILSTEQGKRFLWRMIEQTGVYNDCFTGNSATFYNEGKRSVGLWLMDECLEADPKATAELIINSKQMEKTDE